MSSHSNDICLVPYFPTIQHYLKYFWILDIETAFQYNLKYIFCKIETDSEYTVRKSVWIANICHYQSNGKKFHYNLQKLSRYNTLRLNSNVKPNSIRNCGGIENILVTETTIIQFQWKHSASIDLRSIISYLFAIFNCTYL